MPLLDFWRTNPDTVATMSIVQIVATAGDGQLRNGSACSNELRGYLQLASLDALERYVDHCLTSSFTHSGRVLQDLVNELGRCLDHEVVDGLYQGIAGQIGFDGVWSSPEGHSLIVEAKTTDAY